MSFLFRTELVAENTIFVYGNNDSEVSQFLKKIFGLSLLPPAEVSDCFALNFISNLASGMVLRLPAENYIDAGSTFLPPVRFEYSASSLRAINACESFQAHFNAMVYIAHP
jgi:hypothetical protein